MGIEEAEPPITSPIENSARPMPNGIAGRIRSAALPATTTLAELVNALKLLGATPRELVEILQAIHSAGALDAELEVR